MLPTGDGTTGVIGSDETGKLDDELEDKLELDVLEETIGLLCETLDVTLDEELEITLVELLEAVLLDEELEISLVEPVEAVLLDEELEITSVDEL